MSTEELTQEQAGKSLDFDAHEFDGLRDALEKEAESLVAQVDQYIRENPWKCLALAAAAGFAVAALVRKTSSRHSAEED